MNTTLLTTSLILLHFNYFTQTTSIKRYYFDYLYSHLTHPPRIGQIQVISLALLHFIKITTLELLHQNYFSRCTLLAKLYQNYFTKITSLEVYFTITSSLKFLQQKYFTIFTLLDLFHQNYFTLTTFKEALYLKHYTSLLH